MKQAESVSYCLSLWLQRVTILAPGDQITKIENAGNLATFSDPAHKSSETAGNLEDLSD